MDNLKKGMKDLNELSAVYSPRNPAQRSPRTMNWQEVIARLKHD